MSDQSTTPKSAGHDTPRSGGGFTPGRWVANDACQVVAFGDGFLPAFVADAMPGGLGRTPERQANAILIAAAPDLLEALDDCLIELSALSELAGCESWSARRARVVISKALGTSPEGLASMAMGGGDSTESQNQPSGARDLQPRCPQPQHFDGKESA